MSTAAASSSTSLRTTQQVAAKGHIGLVVLASIAAGLALGLMLVLGLFAGGDEPRIIGSALVALGGGFALLAIASSRFTSQPQPWALLPGVSSMLAGVIVAHTPSGRPFDFAGWIWPVLLAVLVVSSFRGARRSLDNWSRRALLYPALVVLSLIAVGGAVGTVIAATSSNPCPGERPHLSRERPPSLLQLRWFGLTDGRSLQRPRRMDAELSMGAGERVGNDACLCIRSRRRRLERR